MGNGRYLRGGHYNLDLVIEAGDFFMHAELTQPLDHKETAQTDDIFNRSNLTRMQMLYWTGYQLRPDVPLYAAPLVFELPQAIDVALFKTAVQSIINQSDALRTILEVVEGVPRQVVQPYLAAPLLFCDFSYADDPREQAHAWLLQIAKTPFDPSVSLAQFALAQIGPDSFAWLLNQHHIIADATSAFHIYRAVARTYEQLVNPEQALEPIPLQPFQTYLNFERTYRESPQFQRADRFWQQRLDKNVEPLRFFGQKSSKKSTHINRVVVELDSARTAKFAALAAQADFRDLTTELTMFNLLSALFFALIYHLTGNQRLTFMTPMHNRPTQAFRQTVGLLMEICPFVVDIDPEESFASLVHKLKQQTRGVMRFAQHGSSIPLKNKAHDLMFNYHTRPLLTFNGQTIEQKQLSVGHSTESFALHVHEFEETGRLLFKFDFHQDIFTDAQQETAVAMFHSLLDAFLADTTQLLKEVPLPWTALDTAVTALASKTSTYIAPRDRLELDLIGLWEGVLGISGIGIYDNYFDLGGTSWQAMNLFANIEKLTGHYLPLSTLVEAGTIAELADILRNQSGSDPWPILVNLQAGAPEQRPLFLIHGGGGHVLIFTKLTKYLPPHIPIYAFQARGMDGKTPPFESIEAMAAHYIEALLEKQPQGPYRLAGYSMGGAIVLEMAQQLQAKGHQISFLGIIDTPAQNPNLKWVRRATRFTAWILRLSPHKEKQLFIKNRHRMWVGLRQIVANRKKRFLRRFQSPPSPVEGGYNKDQEDVRVQQINVANTRAFYSYIPRRYRGAVTLFKSTEGYRDIYRATNDPLMGWQRITSHLFVHTVTGNHNQIMLEPNVETLAQAFTNTLEDLSPPKQSG